MAFAVMNTVTVTQVTLPAALADVHRMELELYTGFEGFRRVAVLVSEDGTQLVTVAEWDSRDHFLAFRQSEIGRRTVEVALPWHPHSSFFEVVSTVAAGR